MRLMYITNDVAVANIAQQAGVDRIFVDLEYIGKEKRQGGMDTVQNRHTISDVKAISAVVEESELLVRINPIHEETKEYVSSEQEINEVISAGAQIVMLPYFKNAQQVKRFVNCVNGRAKTMLLFETPESIENIDEILSVEGIDEVFIGLNDLSLGYGYKFMFVPLANGKVDEVVKKFKQRNLPFGFGGIASLGRGELPSEKIIAEHYRLGSTCVILSRSFCKTDKEKDFARIEKVFNTGISEIREYEDFCKQQTNEFFIENRCALQKSVDEICNK
ncbi:MAG: aldolase/citrate lyase family protein [Acutalibacteraceae bacterium]|nr:aldolase/citrate lyase family protein [Acutalibacteraceae bacterium]